MSEKNSKKTVLVGMSGGVDSSVAALLLKNQGYAVQGATLWLFPHGEELPQDAKDGKDALAVCDKLSIPHHLCDFTKDFSEIVIKSFIKSYEKGETPNPCIECNKHIKFDKMWLIAKELGIEYVATGHYANVCYDKATNRFLLKKAKDQTKDQTYMLYGLTQEQLSHTLFPLGDLSKPQIRNIAEENSLVTARKHDSQDICFVPNGDYAGFIKEYTSGNKSDATAEKQGDFIDENGKVLGTHKGIIHYTIGQRKGLNLSFDSPRYVIDKDVLSNTVTLAKEPLLYKSTLTARECNFISIETLTEKMRVKAKTRYSQNEADAVISPLPNGEVEVTFDTPQRAITKGQAVVFYNGDIVVGGGTIK